MEMKNQTPHIPPTCVGFVGASTGIGINPIIDIGIAHKEKYDPEIGAGLVRAPLTFFKKLLFPLVVIVILDSSREEKTFNRSRTMVKYLLLPVKSTTLTNL